MRELLVTVSPADDLIDVARHILVTGAAPGEQVTLTTTTDRAGVNWHSTASFIADTAGQVDLSQASAMHLLWSQMPAQEGQRAVFHDDVSAPLHTRILATTASSTAETRLTQRLCGAGVTRREVREQGLVGTLFMPADNGHKGHKGPHPAVIVLNGSGGGINEPRAALYASHGYAAFALAYFKAPGLSDYISNTPLEYFSHAMQWLREEVKPLGDFVALSGQSRGGELVLLLAATFPLQVSAVLAYVPSALVHSGQNAADPAVGREGPTWLLDGKPLVHQWQDNQFASWAPFDDGPPPHRHTLAMLTALQDRQAVARARIPVENIQAPVLLFSATDDGSWPSSLYCKMIRDKLIEVAHPYPVQWCDYKDAGHAILFPVVPTTQTTYAHPVSRRISTGGGLPAANARADFDSWQCARQFLQSAVSAHLSRKEVS